jgi:hypothetical protein
MDNGNGEVRVPWWMWLILTFGIMAAIAWRAYS